MKVTEFNKQIASATTTLHTSDKEVENYFVTQLGRHFAGFSVEATELPDICPLCRERKETIAKRRRNTAYADDTENWLISCKDCHDLDTWCFDELWADYYSSVM